jgi:Zn-dependent protease with chaperone function
VVIGFVLTVIALFFVFPLVGYVARVMLRWWGRKWGVRTLDQTASLAVLVLALNLTACVAMPLIAASSRYIEHRADAFGLSLTGDRVTFASAFVALSGDDLSNPYPPRWQAWLMDHPPLGDRIDFALTGQPRSVWPPLGCPVHRQAGAGR